MPFGRKRNYAKRFKRRMPKMGGKKVSKTLTRAIKSVVMKNAETKVINVPTTGSTTVNTVNLGYTALSGIQYLVSDLFSCPQGIENSTGVAAPNRIGDKINALGFQMDYYFHTQSNYVIGGGTFAIPWLKLRVVVFEGKFGAPPPSTPLLYDTNYLASNTSTLQPINYDAGYCRRVLHDKVYIIKNNSSLAGTLPAQNILRPAGAVFHFKRYFKYRKLIQSVDDPVPSGQATKNPIYIVISAEIDDAQTGMVPSGTTILTTTGFTRAWFKDS